MSDEQLKGVSVSPATILFNILVQRVNRDNFWVLVWHQMCPGSGMMLPQDLLLKYFLMLR